MGKIIFSKYNNERRAPEYQTRTDIKLLEDGGRCVEKTPMTEAAERHVYAMHENYAKLSEQYQKIGFCPVACSREGRAVRFAYVEGESLEERLDKLLAEQKYLEMFEQWKWFYAQLLDLCDDDVFVPTEPFRRIFGERQFSRQKKAASFNNLDLVFSNLIWSQGHWMVIDYEWVFDFPIPAEFIFYRSVFYYMNAPERASLKELGVWRMLGISEEDRASYAEMEYCFQRYIEKEQIPIPNMYPEMAGANIGRYQLLEIQRESQIKVYYTFEGGNFSEECCRTVSPVKEDRYEIEIPAGYQKIRIDLSRAGGILSIKEVVGFTPQEAYVVEEIDSNGVQLAEGLYLFCGRDAYIVIDHLREYSSRVMMRVQYTALPQEMLERMGAYTYYARKKLEKAKEELEQQNDLLLERYELILHERRENADLNHRLFLALQDYQAVVNSRIWRVSKPLRDWSESLREQLKSRPFLYIRVKGLKGFLKGGAEGKRLGEQSAKQYYEELHIHQNDDFFLLAKAEKAKITEETVKFSVIVPLYNTPEAYLYEMIESVFAQNYGNWELCMADGSDDSHKYVRDICEFYGKLDSRIKYKKLEKNEGISVNTNAALEMAQGDYIGLFDHDDYLHPCALQKYAEVIKEQGADFLYSDEAKFSEEISDHYDCFYKPDFAPDMLRGCNYICHFSVFSVELYRQVGGFRKEYDGSQDYDMILRLTEKARKIAHVPEILYYWRVHKGSVASSIEAKPYALDAARRAIKAHMDRVGLKGEVDGSLTAGYYRIKYELMDPELVSIIIPNKDHAKDLKKCLDSIIEKSTYQNYEIIVVENNSVEEVTFRFYEEIKENPRIQVVTWKEPFNYSAINNFGYQHARGKYILLLNNDIEVITPNWIEEMLMFVQREDVGAAGAMLYYPDDTIQHAGVILGIGGVAGHGHKGFPRGSFGYFGRLTIPNDLTCVTAACLLTKREVYEKVHGFDEGYAVAFNDVDFCMKIRQLGYLIVWTPFAELYHYESKSRGQDDTDEKMERFAGEVQKFHEKWEKELEAGDPYYNPHLTLDREDFAAI